MMERLMKNSLYERHGQKDQDGLWYDPMMITELVRNYRSHPTIFHVPNQLFYNGDLIVSRALNRPAYVIIGVFQC
jgi:superfamily I DNA and/or RNA helicase